MQTIKKRADQWAVHPGVRSANSAPLSGPAFLPSAGNQPDFHERRNGGILRLLTLWTVAAALWFVTGCGPPGPRAVLEGKRLLERGQYAQAIEELRLATQLMPTNALVFSYLGLACHQAGQAPEAERAYLRALALDHDLTEVHYNLGCLWLTQPAKIEQAKAELTTYTLRRPNAPEGWLKLGEAQFRSRELIPAERSLGEVLRLEPKNAEALTELGLIRHQRRRPAEAAQFFTKALQEQPDYRPALLNLAIVAQEDLNDPRLALQKYRQYAELKPPPENLAAVSSLVHQLELELNPPPAREQAVPPPLTARTNPPKEAVAELTHPLVTQKSPATNLARSLPPPRSESNTVSKPANASLPKPPVTNPPPPEHVEMVKVGAEPEIKPAQELSGQAPPAGSSRSEPASASPSPGSPAADTRAQKRSFFQRLNPMNLFTRENKSAADSAPLAPSTSPQAPEQASQNTPAGISTSSSGGNPRRFPRYAFGSGQKPPAGDRDLAERAFTQGVQQQQERNFPEAVQAYRRAAQLDPSFYDAQYNLGLAAFQNGNLSLALGAYETALAIQPESLDARYNFGLVLKQAGYVLDAEGEFKKILAKYPNDGRTHLALGNLYAQQLQNPAKAREQYLAVLAVAPQSPQAGAIRYWLTDHPK